MTRGRFDLREHTADVAVEAHAADPGGVFAAAAEGMAAAMCDLTSVPDAGERFSVSALAVSLDRLLYDYLDALIYERDVRGVLPVDNDATVTRDGDDGWSLSASARGVPLDRVHARDLKAVTYSEMVVEQRDTNTAPSGEPGRTGTAPSGEPGQTGTAPSDEPGRTGTASSGEPGQTEWYAYVVFDV